MSDSSIDCDVVQGEELRFSQEIKKLIWKRANDRCEVCGIMALHHQIHHRRPRGMGGSKDPISGSAANGVLVHPTCHARIESNREEALGNGWLVLQGHDPATVPFRKVFGWVLLHHDGTTSMSSEDGLV